MEDIFETRNIKPMLIADMRDPFDSPDWIYELKWDGIRSLAYLGGDTDIINKRGKSLKPNFPELNNLHEKINGKCILDGELMILKNGKPDFFEVQRRALMTNAANIFIASSRFPATYIAYDIIYYEGKMLNELPLTKRKKHLESAVKTEDSRFALSRYFSEGGVRLFEVAKQQDLEGVIAKKSDSKYLFNKRTKDWVKFKVMEDEDFIVCGYITKDNNMTSLVLGQYNSNNILIYKGHITLGVSLNQLLSYKINVLDSPPFNLLPADNEDAIWLKPDLVCIVQYMPNDKGIRRYSIFKGFRDDKPPEDCIEKSP